MLLTSSLKIHSSSYFSFALQLKVGCFMMGSLILGSALSCLDVPAVIIVWIAALAALATACMTNCILAYLFTCQFLLFNWIPAICL